MPPAESKPKPPPCPPPPEPDYQSVVIGTIGKLHLVESRYPLAKIAETMAVFNPDLVLVSARVESLRTERLDDAPFETTYAAWLAKKRGAAIEPIDWFQTSELGATAPPVEPSDETSIEARETELLHVPKLYTFEQANGLDLATKLLDAEAAQTRRRSGDPVHARRRAWIQHLTVDATQRHNRPKKVLAIVDLFDRPLVDMTLSGVGYTARTPVEVLTKSKESLASGDLPPEVLALWKEQAERAHGYATAKKASTPAEDAFWNAQAHVRDLAVEHKGVCCVTQSALNAH